MMKRTALLISASILIISCSENETHTCNCTDKGKGDKQIAAYELKVSKESAAFECKQKSLQFSGNPEYKQVECGLDTKG